MGHLLSNWLLWVKIYMETSILLDVYISDEFKSVCVFTGCIILLSITL